MKLFPTRGRRRAALAGAAVAVAVAVPVAAAIVVIQDWGLKTQTKLALEADDLYGSIGTPLAATADSDPAAKGAASVKLASGLFVGDVLRGNIDPANEFDQLGNNADMIAYWPTDTNPEWGIVCIEGGPGGFFDNGVQRIKLRGLDKGKVETILTGTNSCDGIRRTPWNTIFATEEDGQGWGIEIYNPLNTTNVAFNRADGTVTGADAANVASRLATGRFAWEGLYIRPDGVIYAGDELAPGNDADGGAMYKFVPTTPATPATLAALGDVANKDQSPFASGSLYALQVGSKGQPATSVAGGNVGQANQYGEGRWVGPIADLTNVRSSVQGLKATGYYRPEDLEGDPIAAAKGQVRFCWTNTGVSSRRNWGEVLCAEDKADAAAPTGATPEVQVFTTGNSKMNQPDNIEFQPGTGIVYVIEDTPTVDGVSKPGDIWACLRDGADDDTLSDGCVRVLSVVTSSAEPTGFKFEGSGKRAYVNVQHSADDPATTTVNESQYDEMLEIRGFEPAEAEAVR